MHRTLTVLALCLALAGNAAEADQQALAINQLLADRDQVLADWDDARKAVDDLAERVAASSGEEARVLEELLWQRRLALHGAILAAVGDRRLRHQAGMPPDAVDLERDRRLLAHGRAILGYIFAQRDLAVALYAQRSDAGDDRLLELEREISRIHQRVRIAYRALVDLIEAAQPIGLVPPGVRDELAGELRRSADRVAGQVLIAEQLVAEDEREGRVDLRAKANAERFARETANLDAIIGIMRRLEIDTTELQSLLLEATGDISGDIFDPAVVSSVVTRNLRRFSRFLAEGWPNWLAKAAVFAAILVLFKLLALILRPVVKLIVRIRRLGFSQLLQDTITGLFSRVVMLIGILVGLSQIGFEVSHMLAGLGIAGFILGFALQDSLSNFAAGAMILSTRPFDVGDVVSVIGVRGRVKRMNLVSTTIHTGDNQTIIIPNSKIWGDVIQNITAQDLRRVDMVFRVAPDSDLEKVEAIIAEAIEADEHTLDEPKPTIRVTDIGDFAINIAVRPWCPAREFWTVKTALTKAIRQRFNDEGVEIPFLAPLAAATPQQAPPA